MRRGANNTNEPRPVWRNDKGEIECPGNNCSQECNETCPIFCNSVMYRLLKNHMWEKAAAWGEKAAALEPEDPVTWYNLGVAYGNNGDNRRAYRCMENASVFRPNYLQAIEGLKVLEERLIQEQGFVYTRQDTRDVIEIAAECSLEAYKIGFFPFDSFPNIPELFLYLDTSPYIIIKDMNKFLTKEYHTSVYENPDLLIDWCFYAGIGAVQLWYLAWTKLLGRELMDIIYENVPINELDNYVFKITYGVTSEEEVEKTKVRFGMVYPIIMSKFGEKEQQKSADKKAPSKLLIIKMSQVAFLMGCAYRLHELGMH